MKRLITEKEEEAYRLCHHDFGGLPTRRAAVRMNVSQREVQRLLENAKNKAPQLFPILTWRQKQVYDLWAERTHAEIATILETSESNVGNIVDAINKKFGYPRLKAEKTLSFNDKMNGRVKQKF